jgi:hypothetical protein
MWVVGRVQRDEGVEALWGVGRAYRVEGVVGNVGSF